MDKSTAPSRSFGYARVSTVGQTLEAQLEELHAAGCTTVFREKVSGAKADRKELMKLLATLGPGDELVVTRIDRLARSTFDMFAIVKRIVDAGARFRSLAQPWADTDDSTGRLMLAVLGGLPSGGHGSALVVQPGAAALKKISNIGFEYQTWLEPSSPGGFVDLNFGFFFVGANLALSKQMSYRT